MASPGMQRAVQSQVDRTVAATRITQSVATTYTMTTADRVVRCDATGGAFTVTLPTAVSVVGEFLRLIKSDTTGNAVTVATQSPDTIGSALAVTLTLAAADDTVTLRAYRDGDTVAFDRWSA